VELGAKVVRILTWISYPFLIYAGLNFIGVRALAALVAVILLLQGVLTWRHRGLARVSGLISPVAALSGVVMLAGLFNEGQFFLFVPVLINAVLWLAFWRTLVNGPSMVEIFARLRGRKLPKEEVIYCRIVTGVWCLFFALNGAVSLWLALSASLEWWIFYTGGLSYLLIGILFGTELVYRYWRFRPYDGSITDPLFRKIFPPRETG
jgi:uncharacterized membrane protein